MSKPLLEIKDLRAYFHTRRGVVRAVDGVHFEVHPGETLGIVGESGSGKSVSQLSYMGLLPTPPLKIESGQALFEGVDLLRCSPAELRAIRGNRISFIFQEPMTSLNPYLRIGTQLIEPLLIHGKASKKGAERLGKEALSAVAIADPERAMRAYPHEFSGGMRQRVMIAMAILTRPALLIADEPTTALDVTVQAQTLQLLKKLQKEIGMAVILITHDLGVVAGMCDRVVVMYAGRVFEEGAVEDIFYEPHHPYTQALLRSTPRLDKPQEHLVSIPGSPPDLSLPLTGCPFYERCDRHLDVCTASFPDAKKFSSGHSSFCFLEGGNA